MLEHDLFEIHFRLVLRMITYFHARIFPSTFLSFGRSFRLELDRSIAVQEEFNAYIMYNFVKHGCTLYHLIITGETV